MKFAIIFLVACMPAIAGTIRGRVLEDHTNTPIPIAGVKVIQMQTHKVLAELDSDRQGRFETQDLPPGEYRLEISRPNFLDTVVRLEVTQQATAVVARLIRMGAISGEVTDSQARPYPGAEVFAMPFSESSKPLPPYGSMTPGAYAPTDRRGRFRLYGLAPGRYFVAVTFGASTTAVGSYGSAVVNPAVGSGALYYPAGSPPQVFTVAGGEDFGNVNFTLGQKTTYTVSGKVELPEAKFRAWIALVPAAQPAMAGSVAQAADDGTFRIEGVQEGEYFLFASGSGSGRNMTGAVLSPHPKYARMNLSVAGRNVEGLMLALEEGKTATVSVAGGCAPNGVVELTAVEDWAAQISRKEVPFTRKSDTSTTEPIRDLAPARYSVKVPKLSENCYQANAPILDLTGTGSATATVQLAPTGSIKGKLNQQDATSEVLLAPVDGLGSLQILATGSTAEFVFPSLRPGRYRLLARRGEGQPKSSLKEGVLVEVKGGKVTDVEINLAAVEGAR